MRKLISAKLAGNILLVSFGLLAIFHVLVLFHIVPSDIVWGGQIRGSPTILLTLEIISLLITIAFVIAIAAKIDYIKAGKLNKAITVGLWILFSYLL